MTATDHVAATDEHVSDAARPEESDGHRLRRRALTLIIIVLLIGIPAGYLVVSAEQSRASGRDKAEKYAARGLTYQWPTKVQRRIYDVQIPPYSDEVAHYETNNWRTSRLYLQFRTSPEGLEKFLRNVGARSSQLEQGELPITSHHQHLVGWKLRESGPWYGLTTNPEKPRPTLDVVVSRVDPDHPRVYVVSAAHP